jgi:tRNA modification GTPase
MDIFSARQDTICAIATPIGEGGIGILRISGPDALDILGKVFRPQRRVDHLQSHRLYHGWIIDPVSDERVDEVLASWMQGPQTYTREDVVEINSHSGFGILDRLLQIVLTSGARLAEPGEFTRRAFLSGRIDLSQAEAVIEIIRSRSEESLKQAGRQLQGGVRSLVESWRDQLLSLQAQFEAFIDFSDDLDEAEPAETESIVQNLSSAILAPIRSLSHRYDEGRVLREGLTLVLAGKPNVGKSCLLNGLVGRERAIVTPHPGTTRDIIEDAFILSGVTVRILDTAGLRPGGDSIEAMGMAKTRQSVLEADLVLWLLDLSRPLDEEDDSVFELIAGRNTLLILNKADLPPHFDARAVKERYQLGDAVPILTLSVLRPSDLLTVQSQLKGSLLDRPIRSSAAGGVIPNLRQKQCLDQAAEHLEQALSLFNHHGLGELISDEMGQARKALESILGVEPDDALLDRIFGDFCIGK